MGSVLEQETVGGKSRFPKVIHLHIFVRAAGPSPGPTPLGFVEVEVSHERLSTQAVRWSIYTVLAVCLLSELVLHESGIHLSVRGTAVKVFINKNICFASMIQHLTSVAPDDFCTIMYFVPFSHTSVIGPRVQAYVFLKLRSLLPVEKEGSQ